MSTPQRPRLTRDVPNAPSRPVATDRSVSDHIFYGLDFWNEYMPTLYNGGFHGKRYQPSKRLRHSQL